VSFLYLYFFFRASHFNLLQNSEFASFAFGLFFVVSIGGALVCAKVIVGVAGIFLFAILSVVVIVSLLLTAIRFSLFLCLRLIFHTQGERGKGIVETRIQKSDRITDSSESDRYSRKDRGRGQVSARSQTRLIINLPTFSVHFVLCSPILCPLTFNTRHILFSSTGIVFFLP